MSVAGNELLGKLRKMRTLTDDDDDTASTAGPSKGQTSQQPAWMRALLERCREWLTQLPSVRTSVSHKTMSDLLFVDLQCSTKAIRGQLGSLVSSVLSRGEYWPKIAQSSPQGSYRCSQGLWRRAEAD